MKRGIIVEQDDIIKILADYFNIPESNIIKAQEKYIVPLEREGDNG